MTDRYKKNRMDLSHEIWAAAQLAPGEGIADGVARIETLLRRAIHSAITHCDKCGCSWLDDGVNPIGCPYCEHIDWRAVNAELLPPPPGEASSFGNYEVHTNEVMAAYARANIARAVAPLQAEIERMQAEVERLKSMVAVTSETVNVIGMPELDGLLDHIYEHGTAAEGVIEKANAFARAVIARYTPQQPAVVDEAIDRARFERAPCYICGYNGPGYYRPDTHPCAAKYRAAQEELHLAEVRVRELEGREQRDEALLRQALEALEVSTRFVYADMRPQCEDAIAALRERLAETVNDLTRCPNCGGPADNGHDREVPPNPYWCSKCTES